MFLMRIRDQAVEKSSLVSPLKKNKEDDTTVSAFAVRNAFRNVFETLLFYTRRRFVLLVHLA